MRAILVMAALGVLTGCAGGVSPQAAQLNQEIADTKPVLLAWKMCRKQTSTDPRLSALRHQVAIEEKPTPEEGVVILEAERAQSACDQEAINDLSAAFPAIVPAFVDLRTRSDARANALAAGQITWTEARQQAQNDFPMLKANVAALIRAHGADLRRDEASWQQEQAALSAERTANSLTLMQIGTQLLQSGQPQPAVPPVVNTYCQRFGNMVNCQSR